MPNKEVEDMKEFEINKFVAIDDYMWNRTNIVEDTFYGEKQGNEIKKIID